MGQATREAIDCALEGGLEFDVRGVTVGAGDEGGVRLARAGRETVHDLTLSPKEYIIRELSGGKKKRK